MFSCAPKYIEDSGDVAEAFDEKFANTFIVPVKSMLDAGVRVVYEADRDVYVWSELELLMGRKDAEGKVWGPQERVDRVSALKMITRWAAEYVLKGDKLGSIEVRGFKIQKQIWREHGRRAPFRGQRQPGSRERGHRRRLPGRDQGRGPGQGRLHQPRPGSLARRDEVESVRDALAKHRTIASIEAPATLDGGDVLVLGRDVLVGLTPRSNLSGMQQLRALLIPFGYSVRAVPVRGCLHLKSAVTRAGAQVLVANPSWVDPALMPGWEVVPVDSREPFAGNVLWLGGTTIVAEAFPRTNAALARVTDSELAAVPAGELAKAEGGVTCCSILLRNS